MKNSKKVGIIDKSYLVEYLKKLHVGCGKKYILGFVHVELADL